jgi:large subunit ribosomal protein L24
MSKAKIQTGDTVKIIAGGQKGIIGQVLSVTKKTYGKNVIKTRAVISTVSGINKYRKAFKYNGQNYPGSVYQVPRPVDISNLSHLTATGELSKVEIKTDENGKRTRFLKADGSQIQSVKVVKTKNNPEENQSESQNLELTNEK